MTSEGGYPEQHPDPESPFEQWARRVCDELRAAGFEVLEYAGFPLVLMPKTIVDTVRFLKFRCSVPISRRIYSEGCLIVPAGMPIGDSQ